VVGLRLGGRAKLTGAPLMTSSWSANCDQHFWSSPRYGHRRIRSWDYGMTDIAEGENAKGCSWYKTLKTLKGGKTRLAKVRKQQVGIASISIFTPYFLHSPSINYNVHPFESFTLSPFYKMLGRWYPEFVHIHVFNRNTWNHKQQPRRIKTLIFLNFILFITRP